MQKYPMTNRKRATYHHGNLRETLLAAALKLLDKAGPDAITIREVARLAGVSHAAPVNHFKDRTTLLTAVATQLFEDLDGVIEKQTATTQGKPVEKVNSFINALITYGLKHPNRYRLLWRRDLVNNQDETLQQAMDAIYDKLVATLDRSTRKKRYDKHTSAVALWSLAHGYVSMRLDGNFVPMIDTITGQPREEAIIEAVLTALNI